MYEIRLAHEADRKALVQFINQHWKINHIFVTCKKLLDWQHLDQARKTYNFVIGIEMKTQMIHGILGFIPLTQFDPEIPLKQLCWMAIWKVQASARGHKLGRRLLFYLEDTIKPDILSTVGASEMTLSIYQARGYETGQLSHYFILNPYKSTFHLATTKNYSPPCAKAHTINADKKIDQIFENDLTNNTTECFLAQKNLPRKSPGYLVNRYFQHPIYHYQVYRIQDGMDTTGIIVIRICSHKGSLALRIVDFIGSSEALRGLFGQWTSLLKNTDAEYIDFYNTGIDQDNLLSSGFVLREEGDGIVIPNYFEPFLKKNVEINYMIKSPVGKTYRIVKGDSDQDRPNLMTGLP